MTKERFVGGIELPAYDELAQLGSAGIRALLLSVGTELSARYIYGLVPDALPPEQHPAYTLLRKMLNEREEACQPRT